MSDYSLLDSGVHRSAGEANGTIRLMAEIDETIEAHGGRTDAFETTTEGTGQ